MLTQCPNCQTTFRVTSEILRVAHGQVRCGRCHTQFDALERLIEEGSADEVQSGRFLQPSRSAVPERNPTEIEVEEPQTQEDITLEGRHIEITGTYRVADDLDSDGEPRVRQEVTEEWVEIDDLDAEIPDNETDAEPSQEAGVATDADLAADDFEASLAEESLEPAHAQAAWEEAEQAPVEPAIFAPRRRPDEAENESGADLDLLAAHERGSRTSLVWKLLAAPLVLLLLAQIVHHNRASLARNPATSGPLMNIYSALHLPLTPDWNLHAYYIKQWGVLSDPAVPGTLKVRASITNRAQFAQPYPLLKLVLEDRWGDQVRAREFDPAEYLDPGTASDRLLAPQQQVNATIAIVDPGPDAEGFRFDVCLRGKAGPVCAAEVPE
ncbi:MAG TPA: DUF3426 domain-containing protein [Steroidobacteraceae bacterium]